MCKDNKRDANEGDDDHEDVTPVKKKPRMSKNEQAKETAERKIEIYRVSGGRAPSQGDQNVEEYVDNEEQNTVTPTKTPQTGSGKRWRYKVTPRFGPNGKLTALHEDVDSTQGSLSQSSTRSQRQQQLNNHYLESARSMRQSVIEPLKQSLTPFKLDDQGTERVRAFAAVFAQSGAPILAADLRKLLQYQETAEHHLC